ncbi:MAG: periplasmic heavy metal sensor [Deltaproteobacteria bacterium]|nr:periplasmic heavy metal sensor [Deltaproteobacteria bacterium]MBW2258705.1 periplasmic heavy metal sensor [Deltaproteobacteria bacterium]
MSKTRLATFAIGGITLLFTGAALAYGPSGGQGQGPGPEGHGFGLLQVMVKALDLTEDQQDMVEGWREEMQAEREAHREVARAARETFKEQFTSGNPNGEVLHDLVDQRIEARSEMMHTGLDHMLSLYATLSDDQLETLTELIEEGPPGRNREGRLGRGQGQSDRGQGRNRGDRPDRDW